MSKRGSAERPIPASGKRVWTGPTRSRIFGDHSVSLGGAHGFDRQEGTARRGLDSRVIAVERLREHERQPENPTPGSWRRRSAWRNRRRDFWRRQGRRDRQRARGGGGLWGRLGSRGPQA